MIHRCWKRAVSTASVVLLYIDSMQNAATRTVQGAWPDVGTGNLVRPTATAEQLSVPACPPSRTLQAVYYVDLWLQHGTSASPCWCNVLAQREKLRGCGYGVYCPIFDTIRKVCTAGTQQVQQYKSGIRISVRLGACLCTAFKYRYILMYFYTMYR